MLLSLTWKAAFTYLHQSVWDNVWLWSLEEEGQSQWVKRGDSGFSAIRFTLHTHGIWKVLCASRFIYAPPCGAQQNSLQSNLEPHFFFPYKIALIKLTMFYWFLNPRAPLCDRPISFNSHIGNPKEWLCGQFIRINKWILQGCQIKVQYKPIVSIYTSHKLLLLEK